VEVGELQLYVDPHHRILSDALSLVVGPVRYFNLGNKEKAIRTRFVVLNTVRSS